MFITFEGVEGSGKSMQLSLFQQRLASASYEPYPLKEPGVTLLGQHIRSLLLNSDLKMAPMSEFLLYSACRAQLIEEYLQPALQQSKIVICDRYIDSSFAYQGAGRGMDDEVLKILTEFIIGDLKPDLTILLDLDVELGLQRAANRSRPDRLERESLMFHERVRAGYLELAKADPERFYVIDATETPDVISWHVWKRFEQLASSRELQ